MRRLAADNPQQSAAIDRLERLAKERIARLRINIDRTRANPDYRAGPSMRSGPGKALMDACRSVIAAMQVRESALLDSRSRA